MIYIESSVDKVVSNIPSVELKSGQGMDISYIFQEEELEYCLNLLESLIKDEDILFKSYDDQTIKNSVLRQLFFVEKIYDSYTLDPEIYSRTPKLYNYVPRSSVEKDIKTIDFDKEVFQGLYRDYTFDLGHIVQVDIYGKTDFNVITQKHSFDELVVRENLAYWDKTNGDPISRIKNWTYYCEDGSIHCTKQRSKPYLNTMAEAAGEKRRKNIINYILAGAKERGIEAGFKAIFAQAVELEYQWKVTGDTSFVSFVEAFDFTTVFGPSGNDLKALTLHQLRFGLAPEE